MDVIVVGAGTAGLAAASTLARSGAAVTVLEAKAHPGGRVFGIHRQGFTLDLGAQFFFRSYDTAFRLCRELGLEADLYPYPFRVGLWKDGELHQVTAGIQPAVLWRQRRDLLRFPFFSPKGILQLSRFLALLIRRFRDLHFIDFQSSLDLDGESLADLTLRLAGRDVLEYIVQPIATCLTLGQPEDIGAAYGMGLLWQVINVVSTLKSGMGALADRLYREAGDSIQLGLPARRIVIEGGEVKGVETERGFMPAERVICATTATRALDLMPDLPGPLRTPLSEARYSACCHVLFGLERRLLPEDWYAVPLPRLARSPIAVFTDDSRKCPTYTPPGAGLVHCFTYGRAASELNASRDEEAVSRMREELRKFMPSMPDDALFTEVYRWDEAVCVSPPGMLRAINEMKKNDFRAVKGLFLAGEYLYMPSVEGALRSGIDAAKALLRS